MMKAPLDILVDARATQEGYKQHKQRGIGHYAQNLLERLPFVTDRCRFTYLVEADKEVDPAISSLPVQFLTHTGNAALSRISAFLDEQVTLPRTLRKRALRLAHFLFHLDAAVSTPYPYIVAMLDTIQLSSRHLYGPVQNFKHDIVKMIATRILHRASAITTISENSKKDIINHYDIPSDKIHVTYLAAHSRFFQAQSPKQLNEVRRKYKLPKTFLLYVGGIDPRKNVSHLLKGLAVYYSHFKGTLPFVFAGRISNQREYPEIQKIMQNLNLKNHTHQVGYVAEEDLPAFYSMATAFLFPSLYEGFGLPVVQAMAAGCPVITTNLSSIPEVAGGAVLYMDPSNPGSIAENIHAIVRNPALRDKLVRKGKQQAKKFSWDKTAQTTIDVYLEVEKRYGRSATIAEI